MTISFILRPLEIFYGHLVHFVVIWYNFPRFGILDQENLATLVLLSKHNVHCHYARFRKINASKFLKDFSLPHFEGFEPTIICY
jgi:hypothetical protein